jgi:hypothetical protein
LKASPANDSVTNGEEQAEEQAIDNGGKAGFKALVLVLFSAIAILLILPIDLKGLAHCLDCACDRKNTCLKKILD